MVDEFPKRITKWAQVEELKNAGRLTPAELALIEGAQTGEWADFGRAVPASKSKPVLIRAPLIRFLALGGCEACQVEAAGVQVAGAWIEGPINLNFATAKGPLTLICCHIADRVEMRQSTLPVLNLKSSTLSKALDAQGAQIVGDVFLTQATAVGEVSLSGATIGGQLACVGAELRNAGGVALDAQVAQIAEDVILSKVTAEGGVSLSGATIGGQLVCDGGTFQNAGKVALRLQRLVAKQGFFWRDIKTVTGEVDLSSAYVADLVDDAASWAKCDAVFLANFTYDTISPDVTITDRLDWLRKGSDWDGALHPQPYEQLAKVLRRSGHKTEARDILVSKEKSQRKGTRQLWRGERKIRRLLRRVSSGQFDDAGKTAAALLGKTPAIAGTANALFERFKFLHDAPKTADVAKYAHAKLPTLARQHAQQDFRNTQFWRAGWLRCRTGLYWAWDVLLFRIVGYGYKPQRSAYTLAALILLGWLLAYQSWHAGDFAPNSDVILDSADWQTLAMDRETYPNPAEIWSNMQEEGNDLQGRGQDYATFHSLYYAIDIVVPIISLGQESAWAPSTNRGNWGWWLWLFNPLLTLAGWIVTAIGAAAVTGVIRKE